MEWKLESGSRHFQQQEYDIFSNFPPESTEIQWRHGRNITKKLVTHKQINKRTRQVRKITKQIDVKSFFSFFKGHSALSSREHLRNSAAGKDYKSSPLPDGWALQRQLDYLAACAFRDDIIPHAYESYAGEGVQADLDDISDVAISDREDDVSIASSEDDVLYEEDLPQRYVHCQQQ